MSHTESHIAKSGTDLPGIAKSLGPALATRAAEGEKLGYLPTETVELLKASGMLSLWRPQSLGGFECDPVTYATAAEEVAVHDSAAAWIMHGVSASWLDLRSASEQLVAEIISTAEVPILADTYNKPMRVERVAGGVRVSGESPFASGCRVADWVAHTALDDDRILLVFHPLENLQILDDWDALGVRASASNTVKAEAVFVPDHRVIDISERPPNGEHFDGTLYRFPVAIVPAAIAAVALGILRAALEATDELVQNHTRFSAGKPLKSKTAMQLHYGRALATYRAARSFLHQTLSDANQLVQRGETFSLTAKADLFLAYAHTLQSATDAVRLLARAVGTAAIHKGTVLERALRDAEVTSHHAFGAEGRFASVAQAYWGEDVDFPMVALD